MPVIEALIRRDALYVDEKANVLDGAFELEGESTSKTLIVVAR